MDEVQLAQIYLPIAVVIATLIGPVLAVVVTRYVDAKRQKSSRKLDLFRILMSNRKTRLSPDLISALNVIEVDFWDSPTVLQAFQNLMKHFASNTNEPGWGDRHNTLFTRLLYAIGKNVGYSIEQLDILEGGYLPIATVDREEQQAAIGSALRLVLEGRRSISVDLSGAIPPAFMPPPHKPVPRPD
jgi:hypothetical protein